MIMKQFLVSNIQMRPYCEGDERYSNPENFDIFDDRCDFLLFKKLEAVAVLITAVLPDPHSRKRKAVRLVQLKLMDTVTGLTIDSRLVRFEFEPSVEMQMKRIDLDVAYADIDPTHDYEVVVTTVTGKKQERWDSPLRFFSVLGLPRHEMRVMAAWLEEGKHHYRCMSYIGHSWVTVVFDVCHMYDRDGRVPELWMRVVTSDGEETLSRCERAQSDTKVRCSQYYDETLLSVFMPSGEVYIELQLFGFPIGAFSFDPGCDDEVGHYVGDEVMAIRPKGNEDTFWLELLNQVKKECNENEDDTDESNDDDVDNSLYVALEDDDEDNDDEDNDDENDGDEDSDDDAMRFSFGDDGDESEEPAMTNEEAHEQLEHMVGLDSVKTKLATFESVVRFGQMRRQAGLSHNVMPLHAMFLGAPGTGKTTVAKIIGRVLADIGVLSKGHVVVRDRATLTGQYYSSESENTLKALEEAQGGILFIDEAYQLCQPADPKDPGHFVLDTLMTALADESKRDWMLILAGYTKPTKKLLEMNPGLSSRIPESNHYYFEDFTASQLMEIARRWIDQNSYSLTPHASDALTRLLTADYENKDEHFGNARHVMNLLQTQILPTMACRVVASTTTPEVRELSIIHACDIPQPGPVRPRRKSVIGFAAG